MVHLSHISGLLIRSLSSGDRPNAGIVPGDYR